MAQALFPLQLVYSVALLYGTRSVAMGTP